MRRAGLELRLALGRGLASAAQGLLLVAAAGSLWLAPARLLEAGEASGRPFIGVNYGPFHREGQHPEASAALTDQQIVEDLRAIAAAGFRQVRTYGADPGLSRIVPLALRHLPALRLFVGVYVCGLDREDRGNPSGTRAQLDEALRLANGYRNVSGIVVGNECLAGEPEACPQPVSVARLASDLDYVRAGLAPEARHRVAVTSAMSMIAAVREYETQGRRLAAHCDVVMVNIHPFFAPAPIAEAIPENLHGSYRRLIELYGPLGKPIIIGEAGWPSGGPPNGPAVPGVEHQRRFIWELSAFSRSQAVSVFVFEMFDEPWKREAGGIGPHWGIFTRDGRPKFSLPALTETGR